ncbi:MAG: hypothetical protein ACM3XM_06295 [Mycobacterium leprae]
MIHRFAFRGVPAVDPPRPQPTTEDPILALLTSLRGRQVTLGVGQHLLTGKLVTADPVTLVGPNGEVTIVAPGQVISIQF